MVVVVMVLMKRIVIPPFFALQPIQALVKVIGNTPQVTVNIALIYGCRFIIISNQAIVAQCGETRSRGLLIRPAHEAEVTAARRCPLHRTTRIACFDTEKATCLTSFGIRRSSSSERTSSSSIALWNEESPKSTLLYESKKKNPLCCFDEIVSHKPFFLHVDQITQEYTEASATKS